MSTIQDFDVPGISCDHCQAAIEQGVGEVTGVRSVHVDVDAKTVSVATDDVVTRESLVAAIDEAGYDIA